MKARAIFLALAGVCLWHAGELRADEPTSATAPLAAPRRFAPAMDRDPKPNPEPLRVLPQDQRSLSGIEGIHAPATQTLFSDGFEGAFPGSWTVFDDNGSTGGDVYWDDTNYRAYAGSWSAGCADGGANAPAPGGNYPNNMDSWMIYGPFSLSDASAGALTFFTWLRSESNYDYLKYMVSLDGASFYGWQTSGDTGGWQSRSLDFTNVPTLGNITGQPQVWIALVFTSDGSVTFEGAYVDEVLIQKTTVSGSADIRIDPLTLTYNQTATTPVYVELDWMEDATHSHKPSQAVIDRIVQTFAMAGFEIHIDVSNAVPHDSVIDITGNPSSSPDVTSIMATNFNHSGDSRYYYSLWGHNYSYNGTFTTSSGNGDLPGRVHVVTLGSFPGQTGTFSHQVGTFIHEFGHNLGQRHGGVDHDNYKPNYLSVMNYHYQLDGIGPTLLAKGFANTASGFDDFSYSHGLLPSLNESSLNESLGVGLGKAIDWNCNGTIQGSIAKDIQASNPCSASGGLSTLSDYDNWTSLASQIRTLGVVDAVSKPVACQTWEEYYPTYVEVQRLRRLGLLPPDGPGLPLPGGPSAGMNARTFTVHNDGALSLSVTSLALDVATSWIKWEPQAPFTVPAGGAQVVQVYVDFGQAPGGTTNRRILVQSNDPDESPYPGGVFLAITRPSCYALTRTHSGSGADPVASPSGSPGCPPGQFAAGASISLTASPAGGWTVAGWSGTANDPSTSPFNSLTMPAGPHTVSVQYAAVTPVALDFYTVAPCRAVDTRTGSPLSSGVMRTFGIAGTCGVPAAAKAVALNLTVVSPTGNGYLTLWPANLARPATSALNFTTGLTRSNNGMLSLATDGSGNLAAQGFVASAGTVHLILDVTGYFQ